MQKVYAPLSKRAAEKLLEKSTDALVKKLTHFRFRAKKYTLFPLNFPRRKVIETTERDVVYRMNAKVMLDWLHKEGFSPYNSYDLYKEIAAFNQIVGGVTRGTEINNIVREKLVGLL